MREITPYWFVRKDNPYLTKEYLVAPERVFKNQNFSFNSPYLENAYINAVQIPKRPVKQKSIATRQEGGRSLTIKNKDALFKADKNEWRLNIKGAGAPFERLLSYDRDEYNIYDSVVKGRRVTLPFRNPGHAKDHKLMDRPSGEHTINHPEFFHHGYFPLITDVDADRGASYMHRPFGGQRFGFALGALKISSLPKKELGDMNVCPILSVVKLDEGSYLKAEVIDDAERLQNVHYAQEIRLMPSNVRAHSGYYDFGIANLSEDTIAIADSLLKNGIDFGDFKANFIDTAKNIFFLNYNTRKLLDDGRYRYYGQHNSYVLCDTVVDLHGRAYYADLESIGVEESSKSDLLMYTAGLIYTAGSGMTDFLLSLFLSAQLNGDAFNSSSESILREIKETHADSLDSILQGESYLKIYPKEYSVLAHLDLDGSTMDVKYRIGPVFVPFESHLEKTIINRPKLPL